MALQTFLLYQGSDVLTLDLKVQVGLEAHPYYLLQYRNSFLLPNEVVAHLNWEAIQYFLAALNRKVVVLLDQDNLDNDLEELLVDHTGILDILRTIQEALLAPLGHNVRMGAGLHTVAFAGSSLVFLHHTSYDVGVDPFLLMGPYFENVEGIHGLDLQDYRVVEFV